MSLDLDLTQLHQKHSALEKELADAMSHPASTDAEIAEIKRMKLKLKDQIARLERTHTKEAA
jgi:hypothetical protein